MKRYLLTSGFAAVLFLGACGGESESAEESAEESSEKSTEEENTEEQTTEEKTSEETTEEAQADAKEQTVEGSGGRVSGNSADESTTEQVETPAEESSSGDLETLKQSEPNETLNLENVNLTINVGQINRVTANQQLATLVESVEAGQPADYFVVQYTLENTTEAPRTLFIDQAEIVTNTGQQIQPSMFLSEGLTADMQGAVSSTGTVPYFLEAGTAEDIEWVDIIIPTVSDESYMPLSEEQKYRIEF